MTTSRKKEKQISKVPGRKIYLLSGLAIAIIILLVWAFPFVMSRSAEDALIRIPKDATRESVNDSLSKYFGPRFAGKVMSIASFPDNNPAKRYGSYLIPKGSNPLSVTHRLTHGAQTPVKITINGFRSLDNLTSRISAKLDFPADSLRRILADPEVMSPYGLTPDQALALFVDDTYELYWTASPEDVVKKIGANYLSLWNDKRRNRATILGLSPAQVMTICSIVDEETNAESEKGTIGRLYVNRLNRGMKLQADPTVRFALGDFSIRRVKGEHLKADSPYNTYRYPGLPPGPIRTTGKTTIDLVLDSPANDYIFMCAKEDFSGTHNFASNYAEHQENARKYQKALDARGIN
ncbi:MAG: endolytic transglycosylase MltG [Muribaculaceae bacterium]|nr:endolytic transglycosylase MltG [Muribaculaceae bacterium]